MSGLATPSLEPWTSKSSALDLQFFSLGPPSLGLDGHLVIDSPSRVAGPQQVMASLLKEHSQGIKSFSS